MPAKVAADPLRYSEEIAACIALFARGKRSVENTFYRKRILSIVRGIDLFAHEKRSVVSDCCLT
jgi:hypothetical protein